MAEEMSRAEALKLLKLNSPLELNVGHVQKMIDADPQAIENTYVESVYWDAFHVLKQERDSFLAKEWETNRIKERAKAQRELNPNSLVKSDERQKNEMRRELGDLVYAINSKTQLESQYPEEIKELEKRRLNEAKLVARKKSSENQNSKLSEDILELEKNIAAINNDKSGKISLEVKNASVAKIKKEVIELKSRRVPASSFQERLLLCQQALLIQESKCEDIKLKIQQASNKLMEFTETVKIYSLVETNECTYFVGPFFNSRAINGVNYTSGYSELGQSLRGLKKGEIAEYKRNRLEILNISIPDLRWLQGLETPANWEEDFLTELPDWSPLGWDLRDRRTSRPELWSRSPGFGNNSRHLYRP